MGQDYLLDYRPDILGRQGGPELDYAEIVASPVTTDIAVFVDAVGPITIESRGRPFILEAGASNYATSALAAVTFQLFDITNNAAVMATIQGAVPSGVFFPLPTIKRRLQYPAGVYQFKLQFSVASGIAQVFGYDTSPVWIQAYET